MVQIRADTQPEQEPNVTEMVARGTNDHRGHPRRRRTRASTVEELTEASLSSRKTRHEKVRGGGMQLDLEQGQHPVQGSAAPPQFAQTFPPVVPPVIQSHQQFHGQQQVVVGAPPQPTVVYVEKEWEDNDDNPCCLYLCGAFACLLFFPVNLGIALYGLLCHPAKNTVNIKAASMCNILAFGVGLVVFLYFIITKAVTEET
uniref:Uncharacterized protein n=1 Tax=Chromera velia CCMP2878 TaxID=1169474 RepID=A0A0G4FWP4_9ALVE|eukprot:Cvel_19026.t1-p1 / transcript=Cvel_19026.t1 / gene=Cvel_19026 / organism=Chromera_velia_CCMP2878 / gene_product=hypothetical protein / transcript_product=hypothetical protein / location=Cvel_scaffold1611:33155-34901(-) / protein_length=200 / sequence_SO=supercontig / SO=protein_coding / is_pseudo=false